LDIIESERGRLYEYIIPYFRDTKSCRALQIPVEELHQVFHAHAVQIFIIFVEQVQKSGSLKQRIDLIAGPPDVRGIVFNAKRFEGLEVSQPHILKSEIGRDFGFAFYTTDIQAQAERWARRRAMIESRRTKTKVQAIVSVYEWDEDAAKQLRFLQLHRCEHGMVGFGRDLPQSNRLFSRL